MGPVQDLVAFREFFQVDLNLDIREVVQNIVVQGQGGTYAVPVGPHVAEDGQGVCVFQKFVKHKSHRRFPPKAGMTGERMTRVISGVRSGVAVGPFDGPTGRFSWGFLSCRYCAWTYGKESVA